MPDYGEKNCGCGGKKGVNSELENDMHVGEVVAPERDGEPAYIFCKCRLVVFSQPRIRVPDGPSVFRVSE
jgi:hypothetical protein